MTQLLSEGSILADRYVIEAQLGDGGMGTVYRARHAKIGRAFAIKVLHRSLTDNPKAVMRFEREAELAGRLSHMNVASVVDVAVTDDGHHFMAMEMAPGVSLAELLDSDGPFSESRVLDIAKQLCRGLQHAHDHGLIHRDFKPHNVIVEQLPGGREVARIVDWGVAILREDAGDVDTDDRLTTRGIVVGTPHYMAPEQARGNAIDGRVDLFALGLICYELLTGKLPFDGSGVDVAHANLSQPIPRMSERAPEVHVDPLLEALVHNLLAKHPDDRPQTGNAARELFELYEHDRAACAVALAIELADLEPPRSDTQRQPALVATAEPSASPAQEQAEPSPRDPERHRSTQQLAASDGRRRVTIVAAGCATALAILLWLGLRGEGEASRSVSSTDTSDGGRVTLAVVDTDTGEAPQAASDTPVVDEPIATAPAHVAITARPSKRSGEEAPPVALGRPKPPTAAEVAALYATLGRELKALETDKGMGATLDLWPRYRWIRINEWIATPSRRVEAAQFLERLREDMRAAR